MLTTTRILVFTSLLILATFATLWTNAAYNLATWGWTVRGSLGDATFLPFPTGPRGVLMDVLAKMNPVDGFIYSHLLKTGALTVVCVSLWILVIICAFTVFRQLAKNPKLARHQANSVI